MTPLGLRIPGVDLRRLHLPALPALPEALSPRSVPQLVAGVAHNAESMVGRAARAAGLKRRAIWSRPGRHHIEVHGIAQPGGERLAAQIEQALEGLSGVEWARVNAPSGRVVVAVGTPAPRLRALISVIAAVERADGREPDPDCVEPHPPEEGPRTRRAMTRIATDAFGLGLSAAVRILPFTRAPGELAGLLRAVDLHPRLHALAGRGLRGDHRADSWLPLATVLAQGLTGGWAGILLDSAHRILQWGEARAQLAAWEQAEPLLAGTPERARAAPPQDERPRTKPDGPVERYLARVLESGSVAGLAALALADRKRAAALALSSIPSAAVAGREAYAARLGWLLARRGVIAMDRTVLRELERLDVLVLDAAALRSARGVLADLAPLPGADAEEVAARAFDLFDPETPDRVRDADGWKLGPLASLRLPDGVGAEQIDRLGTDGGTLLGLTTGGRLAAVVRVAAEPAPGIDALPAAARRAGLRLLVAEDDAGDTSDAGNSGSASDASSSKSGGEHDFADGFLPGGPRLAGSIRSLQAEGTMVAVVSSDPRALAAADCGLGVWRPDGRPPWGAHLLVGSDLTVAALVVEAVGMARTVARQSIALAAGGSALGALAAFTAAPAQLPARSMTAVNAAAGLAIGHGVWRAGRLPPRRTSTAAPPTPWHLMPVRTVLERLGTDRAGLATEEVGRRCRPTSTGSAESLDLPRAFVEELANPLTPVLAGGAGLSAAVGSVADAALVGGVIGLTALIGAAHRVSTERSLAELLSRSAVTARVRRDGTERVVAAGELVPGDVVALDPGDAVPADCRVVEAVGLEADESSLTGESLPVTKTSQPVVAAAVAERRSMLYEGTTVAAGRGLAVVVATGADTEVGRGMALAGEAAPTSGVEARLGRLTKLSIPLAASSAVAVAGAGLLRGVPLVESAGTAANLAVASVPEGLPFLVSAAQLAAARRLAEHGALVRNPRTIEALGRVDVLCFDKTGTLTEGELMLAGVGDGERYADLDGLDKSLRGVLAAALRATPAAERPEEVSQQTDRAVLTGARRAGVGTGTRTHPWHQEHALPFEPSRGYHATVGRHRGHHLLSVKGAPETILPRCTRHGDRDLDEAGRQALQETLDRHAGAGQRVLAVAERELPADTVTEDDVDGLTFVGFLALSDGVRESAAPAVRRIRQAGVHTIMITGDHPATAEAIAAIISTDDTDQRVVTAAELDRLDDDALAQRLARTDVVARCTPTHKVRIIRALQKCGRTVAMTGDGANDAPAIRLADVGIALGQRGTPAARAAADLVVTDDRLETIIATLVEGRAMWSSVRHALSILVGGNLGEIAFSVLTAALTGRSALNGRQMLLVNLLTDLAPAMAIAVRAPRAESMDGLLTEGPETSLGASLTREIALRAGTTTLGATTGWTLARYTGTRRRAGTVALASLVGTQLGQTLLDGGASPGVLASTAVSVAVLAGVIQTPGLSHFFGCTPLGPVGWGIAAGSALSATLTNTAVDRLIAPPTADGNPDGNPDGTDGTETTGNNTDRAGNTDRIGNTDGAGGASTAGGAVPDRDDSTASRPPGG
ncbi:cation-translocating P-type ATPase [Plantactinospora sp. BB1]|uniref:cation-translocating P-type ATPase n=1 Tax=Plantactinospora sp. BB1 TaxID=2071627 RepID=UPI000D17B38A|nr:cation-translocating P-type ATPase [Plantactinospora sp. BB1]AVT39961.1 haloacid dehalogenase [Plantactinospora sp. BB1]